jgi:hypothetical protein
MTNWFRKAWPLALGLGAAVAFSQPGLARIGGLEDQPGGGTLGSSADNIPVGIFMVNQFFVDVNRIDVGPGASFKAIGGNAPNQQVFVNADVFIFNPGWSFLGSTTQFIIAVPFVAVASGGNLNGAGFGGTTGDNKTLNGINDILFKADAAWKWGDFHMKIALGGWVPSGTQQGQDGLNNVGLPFFTIQPEWVLSWEPTFWGANWNFTAYTYWEISTENRVTNYQNAPIFHADFTATGTWGKWTIGPVATYFTQVGHDSSSPFYAVGIGAKPAECVGPIGFECLDGAQNFYQVSVGGLLQYNFGPVTLQFWATDIVASHASGQSVVNNTFGFPGVIHDPAATNSGYTVWFQASYALWTPPEAPAAPKAPLIYK